MIRIRFLTPGSLANLVVKNAEQQLASRLVCKQTYDAFRGSENVSLINGRKKRPHR